VTPGEASTLRMGSRSPSPSRSCAQSRRRPPSSSCAAEPSWTRPSPAVRMSLTRFPATDDPRQRRDATPGLNPHGLASLMRSPNKGIGPENL
jgi:hypothetical protein